MAPNEDGGGSKVEEGPEKCNFEQLNFLLKAPSKDFVKNLLQDCYSHKDSKILQSFSNKVASDLGIQNEDAARLIHSVTELVRLAIFEGAASPHDVFSLFPDDFHKNLRELLSKIIAHCMPNWRSDTINQQVSLPRLVDFDWRIDVKTSSSGRPAAPSCLLQLKVDSSSLSNGVTRESGRTVNVELSKETLDTMLDGLGKIRLQLNSVVSR